MSRKKAHRFPFVCTELDLLRIYPNIPVDAIREQMCEPHEGFRLTENINGVMMLIERL